MLNIAHSCVTEGLNGPGRRFTVWAQGCARRCLGCFNPGLQPFEPRRAVAPADLAQEALDAGPLDGVSLSGGEPFAQARLFAELLDVLRSHREGGALTAMAFTGHAVEELRTGSPEQTALLARLDLLVDGPFREDLPCSLPLRGSSNQRLIALTPAGEELRKAALRAGPPGFGITIGSAGEILVTGFPPPQLLARLR